jgi:hypothetical protein
MFEWNASDASRLIIYQALLLSQIVHIFKINLSDQTVTTSWHWSTIIPYEQYLKERQFALHCSPP